LGDEKNNLNNLLYILVPHAFSNCRAERKNPNRKNEWQFRNGINRKRTLNPRFNGTGFLIYMVTHQSWHLVVKPMDNGKIYLRKLP